MRKERFLICVLFVVISSLFFYPIFKGLVPFPGDLLVGHYVPYSTYPFLGYSPGGFPHKAQSFDVLKLLYPAKELAIETWQSGQFPLWNPYNFSGNPQLASLQSGSFYPLNIIFFFLPFISAWTLYIFIQPILAGIFTYLLLREFRLSLRSSLFGGVVFAFSSYSVVWMEYGNIGHSILWLPLAMWFSLKILQKPSMINSLSLVLVLAFSLLAGYIQTTFYLFLFLFTFVVFNIFLKDRNEWFKKIVVFIPIFLLPLSLSAVQLLPMVELLFHSARSIYPPQSLFQLLIPPFHLVTAFAPDFFGNPATRNYWLPGTYIERVSYIGVIPLFFAIYGIIYKRLPMVWFFMVSAIIVLLLAFDSFLGRVFYSLNFPFISTAVPTRIMYLFCFAASILAAFGFNSFENSKNPKTYFKTILVLGSVYLSLWIFVFAAPVIFPDASWVSHLSIAKRNLFLPSIIFFTGIIILFFFCKSSRRRSLLIAVFALTIFDLFYFFQKITPFSPRESVYPKTEILTFLKERQGINRSWGYGSGYIEANLQTHEKIFSTDGYDALHLKRYGELISTSKNGEIADPLPRSEADLASGFGESDLGNNTYRQKILNLLGVKFILHKINPTNDLETPDYQTFAKDRFVLIWQKGPWQIYENKEALPRVFLASSYTVEDKKEEIIKKIFDDKFNMRQTVILEENLWPKIKLENDTNANVSVINYNPNKVVLKTKADTNMLLFLSDNYFPGWHVRIDGGNGKIYRADYSFRAVAVPRGSHEVIFWYYPDSFDVGLKISLVTLLGIITLIIYKIKRSEH